MHRLMYSSVASFALDDLEVAALLGRAREQNDANGVTGILLYIRLDYENAAFLQVLEGSGRAVHETYNRIADDELHRECKVLTRKPVSRRRFSQWTMKFVGIQEAEVLSAVLEPGEVGDVLALLRDRAAMDRLVDQYA